MARGLGWLGAVENATLAERNVGLGRRSARGRIAHESGVRACGGALSRHPFGHGKRHALTTAAGRPVALFDSYHCSRYNTSTRLLTADSFRAVFEDVGDHLGGAGPLSRS